MASLNQTYSQTCFNPPDYYKDIICISNDYIYSAQISSCFNRKDTYFTVLEPPRSLHKYWANEFIMLNNVLARYKPRTIIFAKVKDQIIELIKKQLKLPEDKYLYIKDKSQLDNFMKTFCTSTKKILRCPPSRLKVAYALLEAKKQNMQLIIEPKSQYKIKHDIDSEHIVVSDSLVNILPVLIANYSFSIKADIQIKKIEIEYSPKEIESIMVDSRKRGQKGIFARKITETIKSKIITNFQCLNKYLIITFFIDEFPYGYFFQKIPSTHIYNKSLPSYFLSESIATGGLPIRSSLLIDTGFFKKSETNFIKNCLLDKNVQTKLLDGDTFSNSELDKNIQFLPYDFLFICSHGGFPEGMRFKVKFLDKNNCDHTITIDTIDSFYPTNIGQGDNQIINVQTFYEFVELDEKPWYQKEYKPGSSKTVVEDFLAIGRKNWDVLKKEKVQMNFCNVIATKDPLGPYVPMVHSISDPMSTPFIFNNACSSTYTLATNFIFAGSSFYIGTVNSVDTDIAIIIAKHFCNKSIKQGKPLIISLWESQNEPTITTQDKVYISIGCHFMKFLFFKNENNQLIQKKRIQLEAFLRKKRIESIMEPNVKYKHTEAINFLFNEFSKL